MKEIVFKTVVGIVLTATWGFCIAAIKKAHKRQKATEEGLKAQGADIEKALKAYEDRGYTAANAREELVADSMFDIFDRKTIQRLIGRMGTKDASTVAKAIGKVVSGLRDAFNQYADRYTDTREIVKLRGDIEKMEQIRSTFFKELRAASENFKNGVETGDIDAKYSLARNAENEVDRVLNDTSYSNEVLLSDNTPAILTTQKGVKDLPMVMNASHIRENILTEAEAQAKGLKTGKSINYHGLGKEVFLNVIDSLDDVTEAYRGTKNAENPARRENYFILISNTEDADGNRINVPIYVNEKAKYNSVFIDANKIATVFGRNNLIDYINRQISNGNLVRIKSRNTLASEVTAPITAHYSADVSATDNISQQSKDVNNKFSTARGVEETKDLIAVHNMQPDELRDTFALGGFPMPSIAIIKAKQGHSEYGTVSVVFNKDAIDPQKNRKNKVYGGDAWTPTFPHIEYKPNENVSKKISDTYYELSREYGYDSVTFKNLFDDGGRGNGYSADVVVGLGKDGSATLYDLVNIAGKKITEAPQAGSVINAANRGGTPVQGDNNTAQAQSQGANNTPSATARDAEYLQALQEEGDNYYKVHKIQLPDSSLTFEKERNNAERAGLTENGSGLSPADIVSDNTVSPSTENVNSKFSTPRDQVWSKDAKKLRAVKEQNTEYRRVVASQQKLINALQKQLSAIEGTTRFKDRRILKDRSLKMFAKRLIKDTNSTMGTDALKERLAHIFDYTVGNSVDEEFGGYNENEAREALFDLAMELINSSEINAATQMSQNGDDTFKTLCYLKCKNFLTTNQLFVKDF